jgi:outer membrane biosynthesis protein TonB
MTNSTNMTEEFESKKNIQAGSYTALVVGLMLVIFFFVKWGLPPLPPPPVDEGIEVNLGNSDVGSGNDQPFEPGEPAPVHPQQQVYTPPKAEVAKEDVKDIETNDKDEEAPVIKKPPVAKPEATKVPEKEVVKSKPVKNPQPVEAPAPPVRRPKATMGAINGTGTGGNEATTYKKGGNEGIAGGNGDQGAPGGNPDSKNYSGGGHGNSGIAIKSGLAGRSFTRVYSYQDDFNENATVAVDIRVDQSGNVTSASYQPRGSTTSESFYKEKAIEIVRKSKLNANPNGPEEQTGTVLVRFKVRG